MTNSTSVHQALGAGGHVVVGLLPTVDAARQALESLRSHGISDEQIGLAMRQAEEPLSTAATDRASPTAEEAAKGAVGGGIIGGLAGLLTAAGFVAIPGLAPLLAGGTLISLLGATGASIVAASGLGAVTGGLVGALISINIPETAALHYEQAVHRGDVLITVRTDGDPEKIQNLLASIGADTDVQSR
jgi:hypothetical protein